MNDIKQVTFFMEEAKRMGLEVLGPDVNESFRKFTVNDNGAVRFGMGAVKGVGTGAVATIVENRKDGNYKSVFDFARRVDLRAANKKAFESLALAGGFDELDRNTHRAQFFNHDGDGITFLEKAVKYGARYQENENSSQVSLFGESSEVQIPEPEVPPCEEWGTMEKLKREKEVVGVYISGHPLDDFKTEMETFCNATVAHFSQMESFINRELTFGGVISDVQHRVSKNGKGWAAFTVEDFTDTFEFRMFGEEYLKMRHFLIPNSFIHAKVFIKDGFTNRETGRKSDPRTQFNSIQQLQDVMETNAKKLTINIDINEVAEARIEEIKDILDLHVGEAKLHFQVFEPLEKLFVKMPSKRMKVKICQELLDTLEENSVHYKLN
jgi:DNA polymerase-3 subunit alpha